LVPRHQHEWLRRSFPRISPISGSWPYLLVPCDQLRALLAGHETESGVLFDARTWIITARRRP
jgi:hypothetical protein